MGRSTRLLTKPGKSRTSTGVLPSFSASSTVVLAVASEVARPRITSTSFITGTGFMKCMPMTCSGRCVAAAILVTEMEEVLVARMALFGQMRSSSRKSFSLASSRSKMASITTSQLEKSSSDVVALIRWSAASRCSAVVFPFSTARSRFLRIASRPFLTKRSSTSQSTTSCPASAATWAIPPPI